MSKNPFATLSFFLAILLPTLSQAFTVKSPKYVESLVQASIRKDLAHQKQWLNLLHYKTTLFGKFQSQADGMTFFFSPQGKTDFEAEMQATIRALFSIDPVPEGKEHPRCMFPARFMWLSRELSFDPAQVPQADCSRFEKFATKLAAKSATVVFSSYYLNNPSSAFGHSLLRLNKSGSSKSGKRFELLDYGINYAANADTPNGLVFAFKGLSGLFPGTFTSVPYYYKVREYNDFESRDLWEYDVKLTEAQVTLLVAHIWELGSTYFNYFYLSQNCSYHVLTMLEAANPELNLTDRISRIVIPVDTIRALFDEPGFVTGFHYRPSVRTQFARRVDLMTPEEIDWLKQEIETKGTLKLPSSLTPKSRVTILDAAADFVDIKHNKDLVFNEPVSSAWMQNILVTRSEIPLQSEIQEFPTPWNSMPQVGHRSRRLTVSPSYRSDLGGYTTLTQRFALHDLLDPTPGYPQYADIQIVNLGLSYRFRDPGVYLDDLTILRVVSLGPLSTFQKKPSWRVNLEVRRNQDQSCKYCVETAFELGGGYTVQPFQSIPFSGFLLIENEASASGRYENSHFRLGIGPRAGLRWLLSDRLSALLQSRYKYFYAGGGFSDLQTEGGVRLGLNNDFSIDARGILFKNAKEASLGLMYYY